LQTVYVYPGEDGSGTEGPYPVELAPPEVYAEADAILAFVVPENLHSFEQVSRSGTRGRRLAARGLIGRSATLAAADSEAQAVAGAWVRHVPHHQHALL